MSMDDNLNELDRKICDKKSVIEDLRKKSLLERTCKYDTNITVITSELALLSLQKKKSK